MEEWTEDKLLFSTIDASGHPPVENKDELGPDVYDIGPIFFSTVDKTRDAVFSRTELAHTDLFSNGQVAPTPGGRFSRP